MKRQKPLPLRSLNWSPLDTECGQLYPHLRPGDPAPSELTAAFRSGKMRAKVCRPEEAQDAGALVPPEFWNDLRIVRMRDGLLVADNQGLFNPDTRFYVWKPDFKKIFAGRAASTAEIETHAKTPPKMGPPVIFDWMEITAEIAHRCYLRGEAPRPRKRTEFAEKIADWCEPRFGKAPDKKNILKAIAAVMHRLD